MIATNVEYCQCWLVFQFQIGWVQGLKMIIDSSPFSNKSHQKGNLVGNLMNKINEKLHRAVIAIFLPLHLIGKPVC